LHNAQRINFPKGKKDAQRINRNKKAKSELE
jgi:hypothetical protein